MIRDKVIVLDVSFWQDNNYTSYKIDFTISWKNGADGVIIRAGQNTWVDEDYLDLCRNADRVNFPRGAYWFFDSRTSPIPQADLFADMIQMSGFPSLGIWGDYEEVYGGVYGGERNFRIFMESLKERFPGRLVGVYTGPDYWINHTTSTGREYFKQYPLWIANYKVAKPLVPAPWGQEEWLFWQFTGEGEGEAFGAESKEIDVNFFGGGLEEYKMTFNLPNYIPAEVEEPPQGDEMYQCNVKETTYPHANIRERADQNSLDIGNMYPLEDFLADRLAVDPIGRDWLHSIKPGKIGYVLAALCDYRVIEEPPTGETHLLEVFVDGVLKYSEEF